MAWKEPPKSPTFLQSLRALAEDLRKKADELDRQNEIRIRKMAETLGVKPKEDHDGME